MRHQYAYLLLHIPSIFLFFPICFLLFCSSSQSTNPEVSTINPAESWPGYRELSGCVKWCYSGCRWNLTFPGVDQSCIEDKPNVSTDYGGLLENLGCSTAGCLCGSQDSFERSLRLVTNCTIEYCNDSALPKCSAPTGSLYGSESRMLYCGSSPCEQVIKVLADVCMDHGFPQKTFFLFLPNTAKVEGCPQPSPAPTTTTSPEPVPTPNPSPTLSFNDKLTIGLTIGVGMPGTIAGILCAMCACIDFHRQRRISRRTADNGQQFPSQDPIELPTQRRRESVDQIQLEAVR